MEIILIGRTVIDHVSLTQCVNETLGISLTREIDQSPLQFKHDPAYLIKLRKFAEGNISQSSALKLLTESLFYTYFIDYTFVVICDDFQLISDLSRYTNLYVCTSLDKLFIVKGNLYNWIQVTKYSTSKTSELYKSFRSTIKEILINEGLLEVIK